MSVLLQRSTRAAAPVAVAPTPLVLRRRGDADTRQYRWMVTAAFLLLLLPATVARLSGWRWQPWPPGPDGYRSIVGEAREAAQTYIVFAFLGW